MHGRYLLCWLWYFWVCGWQPLVRISFPERSFILCALSGKLCLLVAKIWDLQASDIPLAACLHRPGIMPVPHLNLQGHYCIWAQLLCIQEVYAPKLQ